LVKAIEFLIFNFSITKFPNYQINNAVGAQKEVRQPCPEQSH